MPDDVTLGRRIGITDQYLRVWRVLLFNKGGTAALLSGHLWTEGAPMETTVFGSEVVTGQPPTVAEYAAGLRCTFHVNITSAQTPNTLELTVYNLADRTANLIIQEFNYIILQAGYEWGQAGSIFSGSVKFYKKGHESATDSYLKIYAGDGEQAINHATVNTTVPEGTTPQQYLEELTKTMQPYDITTGRVDPKALIVPQTGKPATIYGMTSDKLRDFATANNALWYILNQAFYFAVPRSYEPSTVVNLTAATGLVGFPEQTADGINVRTLINPAFGLRQRFHLDNASINQYYQPGGASGGWMTTATNIYAPQSYFYPVQADGFYMPMAIVYEGDSRGGPWYQDMVCWGVDPTQDDILKALLGFNWGMLQG